MKGAEDRMSVVRMPGEIKRRREEYIKQILFKEFLHEEDQKKQIAAS